jgi:outer membrane biosynthesis protein TonB
MRKFILVAAMVLVSATAQAATRGLALASNEPPAAEQNSVEVPQAPKPVETQAVEAPKPIEAPKYVERPAAVDTTVQRPTADQTTPVAAKSTPTAKTEKPKPKRESTEARVVRELHRHGIYW